MSSNLEDSISDLFIWLLRCYKRRLIRLEFCNLATFFKKASLWALKGSQSYSESPFPPQIRWSQMSGIAFCLTRLHQLECASWALSDLSRELYYLTDTVWSGADILACVRLIADRSKCYQCRCIIPIKGCKHHPFPLSPFPRHSFSVLNSEGLAWSRQSHNSSLWPGQCLQCRAF